MKEVYTKKGWFAYCGTETLGGSSWANTAPILQNKSQLQFIMWVNGGPSTITFNHWVLGANLFLSSP